MSSITVSWTYKKFQIIPMFTLFIAGILSAETRSISSETSNDSDANSEILAMVPSVLHKFLTPKNRNHTAYLGKLI